MTIAGYQPLSLIDFPGVIASIVFTQGCPFRCSYCHNPSLVCHTPSGKTLSEDQILASLDERRRMNEGVCVTGGEPTIHPDLPSFLHKLKQHGFLVKLDTNGVHPKMVQRIIQERLVDYIAMDIKHVWEKYEDVIQRAGSRVVASCLQTFKLIQSSGIRHEFRTTLCPGTHTEEDLLRIGGYLHDGETYAIQDTRFTTTLNPDLASRGPGLRASVLAEKLQSTYPSLVIQSR
jgi:pyruvate formate lyase activating enzyme